MKIMIVDDHADMRRMLKSFLLLVLTIPFEVIECESGEQAIAEYALQRPDCVLMDFELKTMNGFETVRTLNNKHKNAKIIMVTGYDDEPMRKKAKKLDLEGFVSKNHLSDLTPLLKTISDNLV